MPNCPTIFAKVWVAEMTNRISFEELVAEGSSELRPGVGPREGAGTLAPFALSIERVNKPQSRRPVGHAQQTARES